MNRIAYDFCADCGKKIEVRIIHSYQPNRERKCYECKRERALKRQKERREELKQEALNELRTDH
jgi:hypothetical protein